MHLLAVLLFGLAALADGEAAADPCPFCGTGLQAAPAAADAWSTSLACAACGAKVTRYSDGSERAERIEGGARRIHVSGVRVTRVNEPLAPAPAAPLPLAAPPAPPRRFAEPETKTYVALGIPRMTRAGHPVGLPGHPVARSGFPVTRSTSPVGRPGNPVERPAPPVGRPGEPVTRPAPSVGQPSPPVGMPAHAVGRPAPPVTRPTPPVTRPAPPVTRPGHSVLPVSMSTRTLGEPAGQARFSGAPATPRYSPPVERAPAFRR